MVACTVDRQCRNHRNPPNHLQFELDLDAKGFNLLLERQFEVDNDFNSNECHEV